MSIRDSIAFLAQSRYLLYIALIVFSYNFVINLVEVLWKDQVKELYPDPSSYNIHMNYVTMSMGFFSAVISILVSGQAVRKFGWTISALVTPVVLLGASATFFIVLFAKTFSYEMAYAILGASPLYLVVMIGSMHNVFCRGSKYTMFDITKEMAFIPLNPEEKRNGKAAIDGVGSRMGKSGGSLIHQVLLMFFGTLAASSVYVSIIVIATIILWIIAVKALGKEFLILNKSYEEKLKEKEESKRENLKASISLEENPLCLEEEEIHTPKKQMV